ncbi:MAG: hypothetical protein JWP97_4650 [Labilithrix sp.]|nr:hypothetical protein [Labilithrix sp.]
MTEAGLVYTVTDRSLLLPYYKRFVVEPTARFLPDRLDPNVITHVGHVVNLLGVVLLLAFGQHGARWPLLAAIVTLQIYNYCDNADGAHARRTGRCSAMGELLDHGLDMLNTTYIAYAAAIAIAAPAGWWVTLALVVPAACAVTYWEQAETGHFSLGRLNQIESVALLSLVLLASAVFGPSVWTRVALGPVTAQLLVMGFVSGAAAAGIARNLARVLRKTGRPALLLRVLPLLVFEVAVLASALTGLLSPCAAVVAGTSGNVFFGLRSLAVRTAGERPHHETGMIVAALLAAMGALSGARGGPALDLGAAALAAVFFGAFAVANAAGATRDVRRLDRARRAA